MRAMPLMSLPRCRHRLLPDGECRATQHRSWISGPGIAGLAGRRLNSNAFAAVPISCLLSGDRRDERCPVKPNRSFRRDRAAVSSASFALSTTSSIPISFRGTVARPRRNALLTREDSF